MHFLRVTYLVLPELQLLFHNLDFSHLLDVHREEVFSLQLIYFGLCIIDCFVTLLITHFCGSFSLQNFAKFQNSNY